MVGGYGFLAVFAAALAIRAEERHSAYHEVMHDFASQLEHLLTLLMLLLFGAALSSGLLADLSWGGVLVGVLAGAGAAPADRRAVVASPAAAGRSRGSVRGNGRVVPSSASAAREPVLPGLRHGLHRGGRYGRAVVDGRVHVLLSVVVHGVLASPVMVWLDRRRADAGMALEPTGE